jgi:hypothetical protein
MMTGVAPSPIRKGSWKAATPAELAEIFSGCPRIHLMTDGFSGSNSRSNLDAVGAICARRRGGKGGHVDAERECACLGGRATDDGPGHAVGGWHEQAGGTLPEVIVKVSTAPLLVSRNPS